MFAEERQEKILEMLKVNKRVSNTELIKKIWSQWNNNTNWSDWIRAKRFAFKNTWRCDLKRRSSLWRGFDIIKTKKNKEEKECIAKKARAQIEDGDTIVRTSFECTVGGMGIRALEELSVDKVFMTTNALSLQKGATTPNLDNAEIKREMMKIGNQRYLLCDSSKIGTKTVCSFAKIEEFDVIITDDKISKELKDSIEKLHIEVI